MFIIEALTSQGINFSIIRFYPQFKQRDQLVQLDSTITLLNIPIVLILTLFFFSLLYLLPSKIFPQNAQKLFPLVAAIVFFKSSKAYFISYLRASQWTKAYNFLLVLNRYANFFLGLLFLLFFVKGLFGFYFGQFVSEFTLTIILFLLFIKDHRISVKNISINLAKSLLKFGFPLSFSQMSHVFLTYADRYLIQYYLGSASLGFYSAGYNLTSYITETVKQPINKAIDPIYLSIYESESLDKLRSFFSKVFTYLMLIIFPITFGFIAVGKDLLTVLASNKYLEASSIIPYVIVANMIYTLQIVLNSGLFIYKKTHHLLTTRVFALIINIGFNLLLIPKYGIVGAAQATLVAYVIFIICITYLSFKLFSFPIEYRRIVLYGIVAYFMYAILAHYSLPSNLFGILIKVFFGAIFYSSAVLILDGKLRLQVVQQFRNINWSFTRSN